MTESWIRPLFGSCHAKASQHALRVGLFVAALIPVVAQATTGGPDVCEVLGWDVQDQKVYVLRHNESEGGPFLTLVYFDLKSNTPCRQVVVPWSRDDDMMDSTSAVVARLKKIRRRLHPLELSPTIAIPDTRVIAGDTLVDKWQGRTPRYRIEASHWRLEETRYRVITYFSPSVVFPKIFSIPGRREGLAVLAFNGIRYEGGYECQIPVLFGPACRDTIDVEWKGYGQ